MSKWFALVVVSLGILAAPGCGSGRPNPEDDPSFNAAAVDTAAASRPGQETGTTVSGAPAPASTPAQ